MVPANLDELDSESVTHQINLAVAPLGEADGPAVDAVDVRRRLLAKATDQWRSNEGGIYWADLGRRPVHAPPSDHRS